MVESQFSLLWPTVDSEQSNSGKRRLSDRCIIDLGVEDIVNALCIREDYIHDIRQIILNACDEEEVIRYRHHIVEDFIRCPRLIEGLEELLPQIRQLEKINNTGHLPGAEPIRRIAWQFHVLQTYVTCVKQLHLILNGMKNEFTSDGLLRLQCFLQETIDDESFQSLIKQLPHYKSQIQSMSSITIGINLDHQLRPVEAVFLSVEPKPFQKKSLISRFLGVKANEDFSGISPFYSLLTGGQPSAWEKALFQDLEEVFQKTLLPIGQSLNRYIHLNTRWITQLQSEFYFYMGAARLIHRFQEAGLTMCKPKVIAKTERFCRIDDLRDFIFAMKLFPNRLGHALDERIVGNDIRFDSNGRFYILTGPNQGGKTTYTRAIGVAQVLFQAGLFVPGSYAQMSPVDWIFTHFSEEEKPNIQFGRLGEESKRLAEIFEHATAHSLVLLNESLASTSSRESLYLAEGIVKGMKLIGCRAVFATHLHELAEQIEQLNEEVPGDSPLISMVAGAETMTADQAANPTIGPTHHEAGWLAAKRTYKVIPAKPRGLSYANDIARLYGIHYDQIVDKIKKRNLLKGEEE